MFGKNKRPSGWDCHEKEDGTTQCQRFEVNEKGEKMATGTEFGVGADPSTGCQPYYRGDITILDDDEKKIKKIVDKKISSCKQGL